MKHYLAIEQPNFLARIEFDSKLEAFDVFCEFASVHPEFRGCEYFEEQYDDGMKVLLLYRGIILEFVEAEPCE